MAKRFSKRVRRYTVYAVLRILAWVFGLLPLRVALALGRSLGRGLPLFAPGLHRTAKRQIQERLPADSAVADRISKGCFSNIAQVIVELFQVKTIRRRWRDYVTLSDADLAVLREALSEGKGVLFVSAHLSNWELLAQRIAYEGLECASLARRTPNPYLGAYIERLRREGGVHTINRGDPGAAKAMLGVLKRGGILGALIDQDTRVPSVFVPFFGAPAKTPSAPAALAIKRRIPVIVGFGFRRPEGGLRLVLSRMELPDAGTDSAAATVACVRRMSDEIEAAVRRQPESWVWFHQRWKSAPTEAE